MRTTAFSITALGVAVLSVCAFGRTIHVAKTGNDNAAGDQANPYLTVGQAASVAQPGDVVTIHQGTYREYVNPPRGGTSDANRIVYRSAVGEKAIISGAEPVTGWVDQGNNVWLLQLPSSFFGSYNPYANTITHDIYMSYGSEKHPGDVFLDDSTLAEVSGLSQVQSTPFSWTCNMSGSTTQIYANFAGGNPNTQNAEILVREQCFYPTTSGCSFITLDGLQIEKSAGNWVACCSGEQKAMIGANGGNQWIIENCVIRHARTAAISIRGSGTNMATTGRFIIRNNIIRRNGQNGICGRDGHSNTQIYGNLIEDTNYKNEFGGAETASIKFHHAIDMIIRNNTIRGCKIQGNNQGGYGIWLDWGGCNCRISSNVIYDTDRCPVYLEVCHGPVLIDNNVIAWTPSLYSLQDDGVFFVHNLIYNCMIHPEWGDTRSTNYYEPHSWTSKGRTPVSGADHKYLNNMFIGGGMNANELRPGFVSNYNAFLASAFKSSVADANSVTSAGDCAFAISETPSGVTVAFSLDNAFSQLQCPLLTSSSIGKASLPDMYAENPDGSPITLDTDMLGNARNTTNPSVGPFESLIVGRNTFTITTEQRVVPPDNTPPTMAPTGLNAEPLSDTQVRLTWNELPASADPETAIEKYAVYQGNTKLMEVDGTGVTITGLSEGTSYSFAVAGVNQRNLEGPKATVQASTQADTQPPAISFAYAADQDHIAVFYTEPVDKTSAESAGNYALGGSASVASASLDAQGKKVDLTVLGLQSGTDVQLTITGVKDLAQTPNVSNTTATIKYPTPTGVYFRTYEIDYSSCQLPTPDELLALAPAKEGVQSGFFIGASSVTRTDGFAMLMTSYLFITEPANYTFFLAADEGAAMYLDGSLIIDNGGCHTRLEQGSDVIYLDFGVYPITVVFAENTGTQTLAVQYVKSGGVKQPFSDGQLLILDGLQGATVQQPGVPEKRLSCVVVGTMSNPQRMRLSLPSESRVKADLFNTRGSMVAKLCNNSMASGTHDLPIPGRLSAGRYVCRIHVDGAIQEVSVAVMRP